MMEIKFKAEPYRAKLDKKGANVKVNNKNGAFELKLLKFDK